MAKQLGKYDILRTLGQGAMGEVYLAHHAAIGREVAIKTILPSAAKGEDAEGRFRREAEAAGQLNHPNLVTIFDFDKDGEVLFLVMEYVKGDDLEDLIKDRSLSPSQFLEVLAQVCDGLSHAHRNGIIHRDIKPSNVRVMRDGRNLLAKVMDFGIARMQDSNLTATGIVMGTVSYMAPEYIRLGHATTQSDLFAVGVMLYECLAGRKPFAGDNTTTILFKIVSDPPEPIDLSEIHGISPSVRHILDKALSKDPGERFQSAEELGKALRACKDPSWSGTLDEATAMLARQQLAVAPDGTQLLQAAAPTAVVAVSAPAAPSPASSAPTAGPSAPTMVERVAPVASTEPAPAKGRGGLFAAAGLVALAVLGGGAYVASRSRAPEPAPGPAAEPGTASGPVTAAQPGTQAAAGAPGVAPPSTTTVAASETPRAVPAAIPAAAPVQAKPEPPQAVVSKAEPPKPEAPKAPEAAGKQAASLLGSDPKQAAALLKSLVQAAPGNAELNANYLAALYRSNNAWDFERGLTRANGAGVTTKAMFAVPAFRAAMIEERNLLKANGGKGVGVLPKEVMDKILGGL